MSDLTFRPRFRIETSLPCDEAEALIDTKLKSDNPEGFGSSHIKGHIILSIHASKRHFWSPQMDISIRKDDDEDHTVIRCLLAPAPVVWTMFMFFYALTGFGALVGFMIASSQYSLDKDMWGLWMALGSVALGIVLFLIAQGGQKLSKEEMYSLRHFIVDLNFPPVEAVDARIDATI
jgi:hypothetical protein